MPIEKRNFDDPPANGNVLTQGYEVNDGEDSLATLIDASTIVFTDSCPDLERTMGFLTMEKDVVVESIFGTGAICSCGGTRRNIEISQQVTTSILSDAEEVPNSVSGKRKIGVM